MMNIMYIHVQVYNTLCSDVWRRAHMRISDFPLQTFRAVQKKYISGHIISVFILHCFGLCIVYVIVAAGGVVESQLWTESMAAMSLLHLWESTYNK